MKNQNNKKQYTIKHKTKNLLRFEVGQEIGFVDENNKIGLTQPTTGADTLTKTDHGNFANFNPEV